MSISERFAVLLASGKGVSQRYSVLRKRIGPYAQFEICSGYASATKKVFQPHTLLQKTFFVETHKVSNPITDGDHGTTNTISMNERHLKLQYMAANYVKDEDGVIQTSPANPRMGARSSDVRTNSRTLDAGANSREEAKTRVFRPMHILDNKPSLHRLIEAYQHTIPLVGHVCHIQELAFKTKNQIMKRGIELSNGLDPQVDAMYAALGSDWKSLVAMMSSYL